MPLNCGDSENCENDAADKCEGLPMFVKCTYGVRSEEEDNNCGIEATKIICKQCSRQEVHIKGKFKEEDPSFTRISKTQRAGARRGKCAPYKGPLTEYKDKYRKPNSMRIPRVGRFPTAKFMPIEDRPKWNSSISLPPLAFTESLEMAEAKLKALDVTEENLPDVLLITKQRLYEQYQSHRKFPGGQGMGTRCSNFELYEDDSAQSDYY